MEFYYKLTLIPPFMTITFYLGKDYTDIKEKFEVIKKYYAKKLGPKYSNSDCFRYIVNLLHKEIKRVQGE